MSTPPRSDVTELLLAWGTGDNEALSQLIPLVHDELHRLAGLYMRRERPGHMLQTTALVNEVYVRLVDSSRVRWQDRAHFFAVCAQLMRRILVDFARSRNYQKRGGGIRHAPLEEGATVAIAEDPDIVALDDALNHLAQVDKRKSEVVELRYFGGLSVEETAEVLNVSAETVKRDWRLAKAWLLMELDSKGV